MTDNKTEPDFRDRDRVSGGDECEVAHFARIFQLTIPEVRDLIRKHGNNRARLEREAKALASR
jgi:hypothetical protein